VYGYSRTEFIVDNVLYYILKRVKGTIEGEVCEVVDDEIISYNFPTKIDKGVKVINTFTKNKNDSAWRLDGNWKTKARKGFYSISGKLDLKEEKDLTASKLFPHLTELKLANEVAFYKEREEAEPIVKLIKPQKIKSEYSTKSIALAEKKAEAKTTIDIPSVPSTIAKTNDEKTVKAEQKPIVKTETTAIKKVEPIKTQAPPVVKKELPKENTTVIPPVIQAKKEPVVAIAKSNTDIIAKAAVIEGRKSEFTQVVNYISDSLELFLYDNGEIDGDTVSVLMNGQAIISKQGLKSSAIKKTIYINPANEEFTLVLFAESLGKYPPNTGLLVIHDGEDTYNLRFSSDFQKSSGIIFKRKKD
jgi:hypothetical protein